MYTVHAIDPQLLAEVRTSGRDASGGPLHPVTATGGEPLRCCLRYATAGEELILFGYEPRLPPSPYREIGAVFTHAAPCEGPAGHGYPSGYRGVPQVLRAYDERGWIHPATRTHDGTDPEAELADIFSDPAVTRVDSRNIAYGCFMFTVTR